jgi:hypothetical protein
MDEQRHRRVFEEYSAGRWGYREVLEMLDLDTYADILIGLARYDLPFPPEEDTPERREHNRRAAEWLAPYLRREE